MEMQETKLTNMEYAHIRQIMFDMKNGVMALDKKGNVLYANPQMAAFFENENLVNETVQSLMSGNNQASNDAFWDIMFDVVQGHAIHYQKKVAYVSPSGRLYSFHVTSSYLHGEVDGIVITVADETDYDMLMQKKHDSTILLIGMLLLVCMTVLITELHVFLDGAFPHDWIARSTEMASFIFMAFMLKRTSLTLKDFGMIPTHFKKEFLESFLVLVVMVAGMSAAKAVMMAAGSTLFPTDRPFFDFTAPPDAYYIKYIGIVFMQEIVTKCGLQRSILKVLDTKNANLIAIPVTSVMFMALHVQHGLVYMLGAGVLSTVLAILYSRHNSIFGSGIVHYTFGIMGLVLGWID